MSRATHTTTTPIKVNAPAGTNPNEPSPQQHLEAIQRVNAQAQQRVELGAKLFKAAETYTSRNQELLRLFNEQQAQLRQEVRAEIAASLSTHNQQVSSLEQNVSDTLANFEKKIDAIQQQWSVTERQLGVMIQQAQTMVDQGKRLFEIISEYVAQTAPPTYNWAPSRTPQPSPSTPNRPNPNPFPSGPLTPKFTDAFADSDFTTPDPPSKPPEFVFRKAMEHLRQIDPDNSAAG